MHRADLHLFLEVYTPGCPVQLTLTYCHTLGGLPPSAQATSKYNFQLLWDARPRFGALNGSFSLTTLTINGPSRKYIFCVTDLFCIPCSYIYGLPRLTAMIGHSGRNTFSVSAGLVTRTLSCLVMNFLYPWQKRPHVLALWLRQILTPWQP